MTKVLIVEDHVSMRESLAAALTAAGDFSVVGEVPNADYALDFCRHLHPDLVLMDVCTELHPPGQSRRGQRLYL